MGYPLHGKGKSHDDIRRGPPLFIAVLFHTPDRFCCPSPNLGSSLLCASYQSKKAKVEQAGSIYSTVLAHTPVKRYIHYSMRDGTGSTLWRL